MFQTKISYFNMTCYYAVPALESALILIDPKAAPTATDGVIKVPTIGNTDKLVFFISLVLVY